MGGAQSFEAVIEDVQQLVACVSCIYEAGDLFTGSNKGNKGSKDIGKGYRGEKFEGGDGEGDGGWLKKYYGGDRGEGGWMKKY